MKFYSKKLKKFFAMICAFFLIVEFSLSGIKVKAAEATPKITYTVTGEATVGKQITISLDVSNISGLYGGSWDFAYDPSILKIDEITSGELTSSIPQTTISNKSGHAYFWFTKTGDTTGVSTTEAKSIAKIKATVLKEGTININTTNSDNSFGVNNKNSLVKLSDKNGDKISYSSEDKSISCVKPVVVLQPGTYDDSNINISYIGNWNTDKNSIHHNGSAQYSKTSGSYLTFSFNGTGFNLFSCTTPSRGIAKVTVDNKSYNVDLYSSTIKAKNTVFSINDLYPGTHKVKIEFTGTKNPASSASTILIDGISILNGNIINNNTFIDDTDSLINYYGSWNTDKNSIHHNGSAQYSKTSGSYLTFSFNGTGFNLFSCTTPSRGIAKVTVDNKSYNVDLYSSTVKAKNSVFSINNLTNGTHNVKIEFTGTKNPASSASTILIDGISILNGNII